MTDGMIDTEEFGPWFIKFLKDYRVHLIIFLLIIGLYFSFLAGNIYMCEQLGGKYGRVERTEHGEMSSDWGCFALNSFNSTPVPQETEVDDWYDTLEYNTTP